MSIDFNINQAATQVKNAINEKVDKKAAERAISNDGIIEEFFKDKSYSFNLFCQKLVDAHDTWILPDEYVEGLCFWHFVEINGNMYTPIQDRRNSDEELEYRIKPSFYEAFKTYFDKNIRPNM